jgi:glycosyltransferase involved in cell wall biosynthesis
VAVSDARDIANDPDFEEKFKQDLAASGITFKVLGNRARRNPILGAMGLREGLRSFRPDLLHVHTGYGLIFQAVGLLRVPTVYTHHNVRLTFSPKLFRVFDRFVSRYIAICEACRLILESHVGKPVNLIFNGVPAAFSVGRMRRELPRDPEVLSVGALTEQKDYPTLIRAAAQSVRRFRSEGRAISFSIAGSGRIEATLQAVIDAEGMSEHVRLLGTRSDVARLMADTDLYVNSSIFEGFPIALIEAAMSGLPTIATRVGGNPEVVSEGETGMLVPPQQPAQLADAIYDLMSDEGRYASFSRAALTQSQRFTISGCADAHLELYSRLVSKAA